MASEEKELAAHSQSLGLAEVTSEAITDEKSTGVKEPPNSWQQFRENLQIVVIALVLALLIRMFVAEPRYIPSDSMLPTLEIGDRLVVEKISYHFRAPAIGEIVVFDPPQQLQIQGYAKDQAFIKRVIGTSGQIIQVQDGKVYRNNLPLTEDYIAEPPAYDMPAVQVPEGYLFVMGDNRNNSNDSHVWGFLPQENVIGHACFRFWPFSRIGDV
jgi:signal peptidase I